MDARSFKPELQGLRAVAVLLVLFFHLDAGFLSGGYVGVDAFFVLSGYFISTSLVAEIDKTGKIAFLKFYERRFRRLLPAATLVLTAILVFIAAFPRDQWPHIAREVTAASIYVENLLLAHHSVDYLAFDRVASPVQHYWSLSVEEQFYFFWPVFLIGAAACRRLVNWPVRKICLVAITLILIASLGLSILAARAPQPSHYFYTHLRVWELALGGLIACLSAHSLRFASGRFAPLIQWSGLAMLIGASLLYSAKTTFPGYAALLPTVGTALVILVAGRASSSRNNAFLDNRVMRWIGDISYSIYLWHWPIIVCIKDHRGGSLSAIDAAGIIVLVLLLAHLTKIFVEDRFRVGGGTGAGMASKPRWRSFAPVAVAVAVPLLLSGVLLGFVAYDQHRFETARLDPRDYPGARALLAGAPSALPARPFFPAAHLAPLDIPKVYANDCSLPFGASAIRACPSGRLDSAVTMAVVGDSHAAQWLPSFDVAGQRSGWKIVPLTKSSCPLVAITLNHGDADSCARWAQNVMASLRAAPPQIIVYTLYLDGEIAQLPSDARRLAAVQPMLEQLTRLGSRVIVLRDTPHLAADPIASLDGAGGQPAALPKRARGPDIVARAAAAVPGVTVLDMDDLVCPHGRCLNVIGNIVVWRDEHHITAHYAETLGIPLADRLDRLLATGPAARSATPAS
jgi:peptidoglycan/LPS O-acetylase OafA/YrhL